MPNAKGGKGYKKGKHDGEEAQLLECNAAENQMYGRTMKSLGNRRFRIFCNDNKERICRVCGSMRKSQFVEQGSLVLISIRDLSMSNSNEVNIGDIIGLIDPRVIGKMKKIPGINPLLFTNVETKDADSLRKSVRAQEDGIEEEDDFFTRPGDEKVADSNDNADSETNDDIDIDNI